MAVCTICHTRFSFIERSVDRAITRCPTCDRYLQQARHEIQVFIEEQWQQRGILPETQRYVLSQFARLRMPADLGIPVMARLDYLLQLTDIRSGNLPRISTTLHLDADEYAHFEWSVVYCKPLHTITQIPGRLIGTTHRCYFLSDTSADSATIDWNTIGQVSEHHLRIPRTIAYNGHTFTTYQDFQALHISLSTGPGGGEYIVPDILLARVMIDTLVRL